MKKLSLALLAVFILPASLSAVKTEQGYIAWGTSKISDGANHGFNTVVENKYKSALVVLAAAAAALYYKKDKLSSCCTSKKKA